MPGAQSELGDAVTVIDGPAGSTGYSSASAYLHAHAYESSGKAKVAPGTPAPQSVFSRTPDYFSEERPFVVLIGKKGVLAAMQELDGHLRKVRYLCPILSL